MADQSDRKADYGGSSDPQGDNAADRFTAGSEFEDRVRSADQGMQQTMTDQNRRDTDLAQEASRDTTQASAGLAQGGGADRVTPGGLAGTQAGAGDETASPQSVGLGDPNAADRQGEIAADDAGASAKVTASIGVQGVDGAR